MPIRDALAREKGNITSKCFKQILISCNGVRQENQTSCIAMKFQEEVSGFWIYPYEIASSSIYDCLSRSIKCVRVDHLKLQSRVLQ